MSKKKKKNMYMINIAPAYSRPKNDNLIKSPSLRHISSNFLPVSVARSKNLLCLLIGQALQAVAKVSVQGEDADPVLSPVGGCLPAP